MAPRSKVFVGMEFNRLTVIERLPPRSGKTMWRCRCICGNISEVQSVNLTNHTTSSCGCYRNDRVSAAKTTHGQGNPKRRTSAYMVWSGMMDRCKHANRARSMYYVLKGITVCERWKTFTNFYADMGDRPHGKSLDRIDGNLGYSPENCRWVTSKEQARNRSSTIMVEHEGKIVPACSLVDGKNIKAATFMQRLRKGWSLDRALSTPVCPKRPNI